MMLYGACFTVLLLTGYWHGCNLLFDGVHLIVNRIMDIRDER
ncbi:MAG TPA: hypothetical protein VKA61_00980 [Sphingomicrobium sp.]|nr:hypothetical protein [Sphingomicrobium sp.]